MTIPSYVQPINAGGKADTVWYNWFQQIERLVQASGTDTSDLAEAISQIATALGSPDGSVDNIPPLDNSQIQILSGYGIDVTGDAESGYQISLLPVPADFVTYDNAASGLTSTDVQAAIDEIAINGTAWPAVLARISRRA